MNDGGRYAAGLLLAMAAILCACASRPVGDLVLDNLTGEIRRRGETAYAWLKRQSASDAAPWERM